MRIGNPVRIGSPFSIFAVVWPFYFLTSVLVIAGVAFGCEILPRQSHPLRNESGFFRSLCAWDGVWYARIAEDGYSYDPNASSSVAFFPAYPLTARLVRSMTGWDTSITLPVVSHVALFAAWCLFYVYLLERRPESHDRGEGSVFQWALLSFGLWPTTMFFRVGYSESVFLVCLLAFLVGIQRRWPIVLVALIAGLATGARAVGVATSLPLLAYAWSNRPPGRLPVMNLIKCLACLPLGFWGLGAWTSYLHFEFGDATAFMKTQQHWASRSELPLGERIVSLLTLEPIWSVFVPSSPAYWGRFESIQNPLFSLQFANPIYFAIAVSLVVLGWRKKWLNSHEVLLSVGLLLIPYVTHSYRTVMMAQGRYASVVFPTYIVMGHLLSRCPPPLAGILCALSGFMLGAYAALFAAWYRMI